MTTMTPEDCADLRLFAPRELSELPPITDSHEPLEDQFFRVLAGITPPRKPQP